MEEGLDWSATPLPNEQHTWQRPHNKALSALLTLRGSQASAADTGGFADPSLYPSWQVSFPVPLGRMIYNKTYMRHTYTAHANDLEVNRSQGVASPQARRLKNCLNFASHRWL